jgi:HD-GYP domain-containing protein (c-di-GMP phosphodiesterase class II)
LFGRLWRDITNPAIGTWEDIIINKKKDGSLIWIKLIINAVYGKDGELLHFIALPIDISRSMQHENLTKIQLYQMIASLSELRDNETGHHMRRVGIFAKLLATASKKPEKYCNDIEIFSQLHDIGKVGILDSILLSDRKLTPEEMKIMQMHTIQGFNIVKGISEMEMAAAITLNHHERYDGCGYPYSLKKDDIPLSARITSIADVYDSLRSKRPYKHAWPHEDAKNYIFENAGTFFDPKLVDLFAGLEKRYEAIYTDLRN